eukprot:6183823-Pleurochrysis_carterae.AAC.1
MVLSESVTILNARHLQSSCPSGTMSRASVLNGGHLRLSADMDSWSVMTSGGSASAPARAMSYAFLACTSSPSAQARARPSFHAHKHARSDVARARSPTPVRACGGSTCRLA